MFNQTRCLACGNNPTPHLLTRLSQNMTLRLIPFNTWLASVRVFTFFNIVTDWLLRLMLVFFRVIGLLRVNTDLERAVGLRGRALWQEAARRGIPMHSFFFLNKPVDVYTAVVRGKKIYFNGLPRPTRTPYASECWIDDKARLRAVLTTAGLPVARGGVFSDFSSLLALYRTLPKPVIIKPRIGSRGRHTTTRISDEQSLRLAFDLAKQLCHWVILEEHLVGSVYRATAIDGALAGVLCGDPPRVTGDGSHTITELVKLKNQNKHPDVSDVVIGPAHIAFLSRLELTPATVLEPGKTIDLLEKIGVSYGGHSAEVTAETHPETKRILAAVAQAVGDPLVGFDFIIADISRSPQEQQWGVIEANGLPFINLHHYPVAGAPNNVAKYVWDFVEKHLDEF
ncbi:hypothetical protein HY933_01020 [Candidatus Falkowbacteria bacterium]|nr:hypothetical protein [Candidatus Falkowbacteria bacterium]